MVSVQVIKNIIDHQVLSSQAYCYSASLPAFLAAGAIVSLEKITKNEVKLLHPYQKTSKFSARIHPYLPHMELFGSNGSPLLYLGFNENHEANQEEQNSILNSIINEMKESHKMLLVTLKLLKKMKNSSIVQ